MSASILMPINGYHTDNPVFTVLDKEDYEKVKYWRWQESSSGYARRNVSYKSEDGSVHRRVIELHRFIMSVVDEQDKSLVVDHINGDRLDSRRSNLRLVSPSVNSSNRHVVLTGSGTLGVSKCGSKYIARARRNKVSYYLGVFDSADEAKRAIEDFDDFGVVKEIKRIRPVVQVAPDGTTIAEYKNCRDAANKTGLVASNINRVVNHKRRSAGGFLWRYADECYEISAS